VRALSIKFRLHLVELLLVGELLEDELCLHRSGGFFGRNLLLGGSFFGGTEGRGRRSPMEAWEEFSVI